MLFYYFWIPQMMNLNWMVMSVMVSIFYVIALISVGYFFNANEISIDSLSKSSLVLWVW